MTSRAGPTKAQITPSASDSQQLQRKNILYFNLQPDFKVYCFQQLEFTILCFITTFYFAGKVLRKAVTVDNLKDIKQTTITTSQVLHM